MQRLMLIGMEDRLEAQAALSTEGYAVRTLAIDSRNLTEEYEVFAPAAIVLDLKDGLIALQHLRCILRRELNAHPVPILALARKSHLDPPHLIVGVDDFLLPPYAPEELVARVRMLLWRFQQVDARHRVRAGALVIDTARRSVSVDDQALTLTMREYDLLLFLMTHRCRVFTREALLSHVWGAQFEGDERVVDATVRRVRARLPAEYAGRIETVRGLGYRFASDPVADTAR